MRKICKSCKSELLLSEFYKNKTIKSGLDGSCKYCHQKSKAKYKRSKKGLISNIYGQQRSSSKLRGHILPTYSALQFKDWIYAQNNFQHIFDNWVKSNYNKDLIPSVDRLDVTLPYSFSNIQLITWRDNRVREVSRISSKVYCYKDNKFVKSYPSLRKAGRDVGIRSVCRIVDTGRTAKGFVFKSTKTDLTKD